jgi:hypothetical protein
MSGFWTVSDEQTPQAFWIWPVGCLLVMAAAPWGLIEVGVVHEEEQQNIVGSLAVNPIPTWTNNVAYVILSRAATLGLGLERR